MKATKPDPKICSICQQPFTEYGNNAKPVNNGRCCDECDRLVVIPARLASMGYSKATARAVGEALNDPAYRKNLADSLLKEKEASK